MRHTVENTGHPACGHADDPAFTEQPAVPRTKAAPNGAAFVTQPMPASVVDRLDEAVPAATNDEENPTQGNQSDGGSQGRSELHAG